MEERDINVRRMMRMRMRKRGGCLTQNPRRAIGDERNGTSVHAHISAWWS